MFRKRISGVLMHVTALPSSYGIGDLGPQAHSFVDFLKQANQSLWQVLPININTAQTGFSPYSCMSAFAGNPLLISPEGLYQAGWLTKKDLTSAPKGPVDQVNFTKAQSYKLRLLKQAYSRFQQNPLPADYHAFLDQHRGWLNDFALFAALKQKMGPTSWNTWPKPLRDRQAKAINQAAAEMKGDLDFIRFCQYCFFTQYQALHQYSRAAGIQLMGDVPIYVDYESADVWAHPKLFKLGADKRPEFKAGVPPDYFSRTGQLWGNPVYDWKRMQSKDNYAWFTNRIAHNLGLFDCLRIDHFRGLVAYWQVPAKHKTAIRGKWIPGPGSALLNALYDRLPFAQLFAEDLGFITPDVRQLIQQFELPGMAVLQFGFSNPYKNVHCAHNIQTNTIVYTGTHDNNTTRGWFSKDLSKEQQKHVSAYIGHQVTANSAAKDLIRLAWQSPARVAIVPMQDLLNLDHKARMNFPGKATGNWAWRIRPNAISPKLVRELAEITHRYGRN